MFQKDFCPYDKQNQSTKSFDTGLEVVAKAFTDIKTCVLKSNQDSKSGDIDGFDNTLQIADLATKKDRLSISGTCKKQMGDTGFEPVTR